jgi:hypothetical protein
VGIQICHYLGGPSDGKQARQSGSIPRTWTVGEIVLDHVGHEPDGGRYMVVGARTVGDAEVLAAQWLPGC